MAAENPGWTGLLDWWGLEESSSPAVGDFASTSMTGSNVTFQVTGIQNYGIDFENSSNSYMYGPSSFPHDEDAQTICFWYKPESISVTQNMIKKWNTSGQYEFAIAWIWGGGATRRMRYYASSNGTASFTCDSGPEGVAGSWQHYFCRYNGSQLQIWRNDLYTHGACSYSSGINSGGTDLLKFSDSSSAMDGVLDEPSIWEVAQSDDEREWHYNSGSGRTFSELDPMGQNFRIPGIFIALLPIPAMRLLKPFFKKPVSIHTPSNDREFEILRRIRSGNPRLEALPANMRECKDAIFGRNWRDGWVSFPGYKDYRPEIRLPAEDYYRYMRTKKNRDFKVWEFSFSPA